MTTGDTPRKFRRPIWALLILLAVGWYGFYQAHDLIYGPSLQVEQPVDGLVVEEQGTILVRGRASRAKKLTLNGREISISPQGEFIERLPLAGRYTIITLEATDRFSQVDQVKKTVLKTDDLPDPHARDWDQIKEELKKDRVESSPTTESEAESRSEP